MEHKKPSYGSTDSPTGREPSTSNLFPTSDEAFDRGRQSRAEQELEHVRGQAQDAKETLKEEGRAFAEQGRAMAHDVAEDARDVAEGYIGEATRQLDGIAQALGAAASQLRDQGQVGIAEQVDEVCGGIERMCDRLEHKNFDALANDARTLARDNPTAFLGGSVAIGFALSRLFKASATRSQREDFESEESSLEFESEESSLEDEALRPDYGQDPYGVESPTYYNPQRS